MSVTSINRSQVQTQIDSASILVVDDNEIILETLSDILTQMGYEVETTHSGHVAIERVQDRVFDLVICDIKMPEMSGLELLESIRGYNAQIPVIIITGFPSIDLAIEAMKKGAADFIPKPFDVELIEHLIRRIIRERSLVVQNEQLAAELNQKAVIEILNRDLNSKVDQLTKLVTVNERLASITDNERLFAESVRLANEITSAEKISLMIYDRSTSYLTIRAALGVGEDVIRGCHVRLGEGVVGKVAQMKQSINQTRLDSCPIRSNPMNRSYNAVSFLCVPLLIGDELFGVLNLADKGDRGDFTENERWLVEQLAEKMAIRIENNILYEGIYSNLIDTLKTLVFTIEARDSYTRQHSQRVTVYAMAVAKKMGFNEDELEQLKFSGILHDIGKIGVSDMILMKPGKLTREEFDVIKTHPVIGDAIVEPLGLSDMERKVIRHHHERIDGRGYPDGLKGDQLPMLVRVAGAADAFDAMTSTRPYRSALTMEQAFEEMIRCKDEQFDPACVDALIECVEEGRILVPDQDIVFATNPLDLNALKTPLPGC